MVRPQDTMQHTIIMSAINSIFEILGSLDVKIDWLHSLAFPDQLCVKAPTQDYTLALASPTHSPHRHLVTKKYSEKNNQKK